VAIADFTDLHRIALGGVSMARRAFYSFHYVPDNWRAAQVRNIGFVEGNQPATDNAWETVKRGGDTAIKKWIDDQLSNRSVVVVLIGSNTAGRKWINYEIEAGWKAGKGVLGVHVHNLKDATSSQASKGTSPFSGIRCGTTILSSVVKVYDPPFTMSTNVYKHINDNLADWIETAIEIRGKY